MADADIMSAIDGGGWYGHHNGKQELVLAWGFLTNGNIIPIFAGDLIQPGHETTFWHQDQFRA